MYICGWAMHLLAVLYCMISCNAFNLCKQTVLGKMFRFKLDLPEWKTDEDIARHLLKLVCRCFVNYVCLLS